MRPGASIRMGNFLELENIQKSFGATKALRGVTFAVARGEVRALLGENGAGKSTCVKILNGLVTPDSGSMRLGDAVYRPRHLTDAHQSRVSTAFQELSLLPDLSVSLNLCMPELPRNRLGIIQYSLVREVAENVLERFGATDIDSTVAVSSLALADKQRLEIIRAFSRDPELLILDEPTAALTDVTWLYAQIHRLTATGGAVLFITHRLKEVRDLCKNATVLRNGCVEQTVALSEADDSELFSLMIGRSASQQGERSTRTVCRSKNLGNSVEALKVRGLVSGAFGPGDLTVGAGEIVGVAGLEGQGQRALFRALAGIAPMHVNELDVAGRAVKIKSAVSARRAGLSFVPEERKSEGLFLNMETRANVSVAKVRRLARLGVLSTRKEVEAIEKPCRAVALDRRYYQMPIDQLSGGNQQKALIARALLSGGKCLLLFDPTRGVDVGTKESIYDSMRTYASMGVGILFYSTELRELTILCDRCVVVYGNRIVGSCVGSDITEERLIELMHGSTSSTNAEESA